MKRKASISHDKATVRELRDNPDFAAEYLRAALEDADEPSVLLIALRRIAEARGGMAKVAKAAGIERESLYRALSVRGNPRLSTLVAVTKAVGLRLTVEAAPCRPPGLLVSREEAGAPRLALFETWAAGQPTPCGRGIERESLYRALSVRGNPRLSTLVAV